MTSMACGLSTASRSRWRHRNNGHRSCYVQDPGYLCPDNALTPSSAPWTLGIHPYVHPGRTRCMRHGLPHARRIGRGMLLLLLPLRAFGHGRTGKFVDRAVAAGTLENPIAAGVDHSRHLAVAWHIFPTVPGVPLRIDLGGDGHAANLQHRRHATL